MLTTGSISTTRLTLMFKSNLVVEMLPVVSMTFYFF